MDTTNLKCGFTETQLYCMTLDHFTIDGVVGEGSMGKIYLAKYNPTGMTYALKIIKYDDSYSVRNGIHIYPELIHENLMRCYGSFTQIYEGDKCIVIVMEFIEGNDLHDIANECDNKYLYKIVPIVIEGVAKGLKYIHDKGYIHRDIKLENIILTPEGEIKIIDYDFVIKRGHPGLSSRCGTPFYVSPDILKDSVTTDHRTDIWSLGVVVYILLTGDYPFDAEDRNELFHRILYKPINMKYIPNEYTTFITGTLTKNPDKRITLDQILNKLEELELEELE